MKTPWMQTEYTKLPEDEYSTSVINENSIRILLNNGKSNAILSNDEYNAYMNGNLSLLRMENLYFRGLAIDDEGEKVECEDVFLTEDAYSPLSSAEYSHFVIKTDSQNYDIVLNPEIGSWVAFENDEFEHYLKGTLDSNKMENLYLRSLAKDKNDDFVEMDFPAPAERPSVIVVNLTMACNLRCKYCFAACEPGKGDFMQEDVMSSVISQMLQMPSKLITFELQGGEPLFYFDGMKKFVLLAEEMNKKYNKVIQFRTVTNATLINDEVISFAKAHNIAICVSLDGNKEMTNQTRVYADGRGAFDEIIKGVKKLKEEYQVDGAVCTVGQHNMKYAEQIMQFFIEQGISFKPRPANILGRELENHTTTHSGEWADAFITMHKMSEDAPIENYSVHIHEENVYGPVRDYICLRYPCGAAREVISVNPDGSVFPCDGFKNEQEFNMGNITTESLDTILEKDWIKELRNRTHKDIEKCNKCMFKAMCCSCCYSAYGAYGTVYREDPQCADRRRIFMYLIKTWLEKNE